MANLRRAMTLGFRRSGGLEDPTHGGVMSNQYSTKGESPSLSHVTTRISTDDDLPSGDRGSINREVGAITLDSLSRGRWLATSAARLTTSTINSCRLRLNEVSTLHHHMKRWTYCGILADQERDFESTVKLCRRYLSAISSDQRRLQLFACSSSVRICSL